MRNYYRVRLEESLIASERIARAFEAGTSIDRAVVRTVRAAVGARKRRPAAARPKSRRRPARA